MNETIGSTVVGAYVGAVRDELADLPEDVRAELVDDVVEHVATVAAEYDPLTMAALVERLGAPAAYAAELREAAGLSTAPIPDERRDGYLRRLGRFLTVSLVILAAGIVALAIAMADTGPLWFSGIVAAGALGLFAVLVRDGRDWKDEVSRMPGAAALRRGRRWFVEQNWSDDAIDFSVSLRPGWWVLRGAALAIALGIVAKSVAVIAVSMLPLLAVSVWWGRRIVAHRPRGRGRIAAVAVNGALVLTTIGTAISVYEEAVIDETVVYVADDSHSGAGYTEPHPVDNGGVWRSDMQVTNLFPYGPDGQMLEGVRLYDQEGRPFELGLAETSQNVSSQPWCEPGWVYLPRGDPANAFPHRLIEGDAAGECLDPVTEPPFGPFLPGSTPDDDTSSREPTPSSESNPSGSPTPPEDVPTGGSK